MGFKRLEQFLKRFYNDYPEEGLDIYEKVKITIKASSSLALLGLSLYVIGDDGKIVLQPITAAGKTVTRDYASRLGLINIPNPDDQTVTVTFDDPDSAEVIYHQNTGAPMAVVAKKKEVVINLTFTSK